MRDVLDQVVKLAPEYSWYEMNGVAVIRPTAAWTDPNDELNVVIPALHIDDATARTVLHRLLLPDHPDPATPGGRDVFTFDFSGGAIVDALNVLVKTGKPAIWTAHLLVHETPSGHDQYPSQGIGVMTLPGGPADTIATPRSRVLARR